MTGYFPIDFEAGRANPLHQTMGDSRAVICESAQQSNRKGGKLFNRTEGRLSYQWVRDKRGKLGRPSIAKKEE